MQGTSGAGHLRRERLGEVRDDVFRRLDADRYPNGSRSHSELGSLFRRQGPMGGYLRISSAAPPRARLRGRTRTSPLPPPAAAASRPHMKANLPARRDAPARRPASCARLGPARCRCRCACACERPGSEVLAVQATHRMGSGCCRCEPTAPVRRPSWRHHRPRPRRRDPSGRRCTWSRCASRPSRRLRAGGKGSV